MMGYKSSRYRLPEPLGPSCRKNSYHSREEAEDMIRHIAETRYTKALHAYQCPVCGLWHLSSGPLPPK